MGSRGQSSHKGEGRGSIGNYSRERVMGAARGLYNQGGYKDDWNKANKEAWNAAREGTLEKLEERIREGNNGSQGSASAVTAARVAELESTELKKVSLYSIMVHDGEGVLEAYLNNRTQEELWTLAKANKFTAGMTRKTKPERMIESLMYRTRTRVNQGNVFQNFGKD